MKKPAKQEGDEAARLVATANSYLRLGLADKAIDHLAGALRRDPSLRALREPLMKLYVLQGEHHKAVAELWALLSGCTDPQEEIRMLRYVLRLDANNAAAAQRLKTALDKQQATAAPASGEESEPGTLLRGIAADLRAYLYENRPLSDLAQTVRRRETEQLDAAQEMRQSHAVTRPITPEMEELAEDMALSTGNLKEQLREVDDSLRQRRYDDAQRQLWALRGRYPHSKQVRDRIKKLEQAHPQPAGAARPAAADSASKKAPAVNIHAAKTLPLGATARAGKAEQPGQQTIEVALEDIREEEALPPAAPSSYPPPPPLPKANRQRTTMQSLSDAEMALRNGAMLWSAGRRMQAIDMFDKARGDATCGVMAALMAGLCYREIESFDDAIASFTFAINRPEISDSDLSWLYYEFGITYELLKNAREAILYYQLSLGATGSFRDAEQRIAGLQASLAPT